MKHPSGCFFVLGLGLEMRPFSHALNTPRSMLVGVGVRSDPKVPVRSKKTLNQFAGCSTTTINGTLAHSQNNRTIT